MKTNRLFTLILLVTMFFSLYTQSGVAAEDSAATFDVVSFEYCDGIGASITDLSTFTANQVIKAKATVKNVGTAPGSITLMIMAYQDGKLIRFASAAVNDIAVSATAPASAQITLPSNTTGCEVYSYIWKDLTNMGALTKAAVAGSKNPKIDSLKICNVPVSFDADGNADVEFPFGFTGVLEKSDFEFDFADISTSFEDFSLDSDNKVITIYATPSGGSTYKKEYKVNYTIAPPNITIMYNSDYDKATNPIVELTDTGILRAPDPRLTDPENQSKTAGEALGGASDDYSLLADNASLVWSNYKAEYYETVPVDLVGATYYRLPKDISEHLRTEITVTTEHDIRLYYTGYPSVLYTPEGRQHEATEITVKATGDSDYPTAPLSSYTSSNLLHTDSDGKYKLFYKDIRVPAGQTSVTEIVKCGNAPRVGMFIAYKIITPELD